MKVRAKSAEAWAKIAENLSQLLILAAVSAIWTEQTIINKIVFGLLVFFLLAALVFLSLKLRDLEFQLNKKEKENG